MADRLHLGDQNLLVNVLGAALLGLLAGLAAPRRQLLLGIGFCGSVTTFSSWMLAAMKQLSAGDWAAALGLIGLTLGWAWGQQLWVSAWGDGSSRQRRRNRRLEVFWGARLVLPRHCLDADRCFWLRLFHPC